MQEAMAVSMLFDNTSKKQRNPHHQPAWAVIFAQGLERWLHGPKSLYQCFETLADFNYHLPEIFNNRKNMQWGMVYLTTVLIHRALLHLNYWKPKCFGGAVPLIKLFKPSLEYIFTTDKNVGQN